MNELTVRQGNDEWRFVVIRNPERAERNREKRDDAISRFKRENLPRLNRQIKEACAQPEAEEEEYFHPLATCEFLYHDFYGHYEWERADGSLTIECGRVHGEERRDGKSLLSMIGPSLSTEVATSVTDSRPRAASPCGLAPHGSVSHPYGRSPVPPAWKWESSLTHLQLPRRSPVNHPSVHIHLSKRTRPYQEDYPGPVPRCL